jgi:hypothetical protein
MKRLILVFILFLLSCAPAEFARLMGVGLKPFKEQGKVYSKDIDKNKSYCYQRVKDLTKGMQAQVYRRSKSEDFIVAIGFNAAFKQCNSSTEVAIFFTELDSGQTKVEVASLNYSLAEFIAPKLFEGIEKEE